VRLTTFTDYCLRVLMFVATAPEGRTTIAEVAKAFSISENHLVKVVHFLGREGFLANSRGRGGGLRLARPPGEINVGALVRASEGDIAPAQCFEHGGERCAIESLCRLTGVLVKATGAFYRVLDAATLADVIANRGPLAAVLHGPPAARSEAANA
jgi:Rrf2 family nitric oxide-sensitive transcriptional repressor